MTKIKSRSNLPDEHHVVRHVPFQRLRRDEDGNILGVLYQAFLLRPGEESLSVNWLEHFDGDHVDRTKKLIRELRAAKDISKNSKCAFGIGNVATIKETCENNNAIVKIVYAPTRDIPSHSEILRLPRDDLSLLEALATEAFCELVRNCDIED